MLILGWNMSAPFSSYWIASKLDHGWTYATATVFIAACAVFTVNEVRLAFFTTPDAQAGLVFMYVPVFHWMALFVLVAVGLVIHKMNAARS